ncbi:hypothetical protein LLG88_13645 [bacterium]|nr:hypothetical protein [bacterium]
MSLPGSLLSWIDLQFHDAIGAPLAGGTLECFEAGSTTVHKAVYTDAGRTVEHDNPLVLGSDGRPSASVFLGAGGYQFVLKDANGDQVGPPHDGAEDVGLTWLERFGLELAAGTKSVTDFYAIVSTDVLVTVASSGGPNPCHVTMPPAAGRGKPLIVKNVGTQPIALYPVGSDTIDGVEGAYTIPVAADGVCPSILLVSDGVSAWSILASHGVV